MGRKVHPYGFRIGIVRNWEAKWYADEHYGEFLQEDLKLRQAIRDKYPEAGISLVETERQANKVIITVHTARPGVVIGRGGQRVDEMRQFLESQLVGKRVQLNIQEIHQPELDAYLVGRSIAEQIERRIAYRRAMKQAIFRTIQAGAKGIRIRMAGRLAGAEIARRQLMHEGRVPLHTIRADIDYGFTEAHTIMGRIGIKIWIYKGDILPELKTEEGEAAAEGTAPIAAVTQPVVGAPTATPATASVLAVPAAPASAMAGGAPANTGTDITGKEA
jgi:small subunit ribosomal protein S3